MLDIEEVTYNGSKQKFNNVCMFLNHYYNTLKQHHSEFKIPQDARIFLSFDPQKDKSWEAILGAAVIFNWCPEAETADIAFIPVVEDARYFFTGEFINYTYYYLFDFLHLRIVYSSISEKDTRQVYNYRNFGYNEVKIPQKLADDEDEILFYLKRKTWKDKESKFNGKNAKIRKAANNWIRQQEQQKQIGYTGDPSQPESIPLEDHWGAVPAEIQDIALSLPEHKRDQLYLLLTKE